MPAMTETFDPANGPARFAIIFGADPARAVVRCKVHDYDQSIELFFAPTTPPTWVPDEAQLKSVCALGFTAVYCDFADDTEYVGCWRTRIVEGKKAGDYWVQSARREKVGYPRYSAG